MFARAISVCLVVVAACGGGGGGAEVVDAAPGAPDAFVPDPSETLSVTLGPVTAAPGAEDTVCVVLDLGNDDPLVIRRIRTQLDAGTHHVIVSRVDDPVDTTPRSCGAFAAGSDGGVLFIAQQREAELAYPEGTGMYVGPHQHIHLEMHYYNYLEDDAAISGTALFDLAPADGPALAPVELLFTGDFSLLIRAHSSATKQSFHEVPPGAKLFALTSHTHQYGTRATIERARSLADPDGELLHESLVWSEPPLDVFEPFALEPGEGLRLTCEFFNTSDDDVSFGLGFNDEMCFLWAHYFFDVE